MKRSLYSVSRCATRPSPYLRNPRRWASWFLQVTDEQGQFFRTPIGHPALEIVAPEVRERGGEELRSKAIQPTTIVPAQHGAASRDRPGGPRSGAVGSPATHRTIARTQSSAARRAFLSISHERNPTGSLLPPRRTGSLTRLPLNDTEAFRIANNLAQRAQPIHEGLFCRQAPAWWAPPDPELGPYLRFG